jgi:hypothetical protein
MKSKIALFVIALVYLVSFRQYANYNSFLQGGGDSWGYYAYLPASFIYHDLDDLQADHFKSVLNIILPVCEHRKMVICKLKRHMLFKNIPLLNTPAVSQFCMHPFFWRHMDFAS